MPTAWQHLEQTPHDEWQDPELAGAVKDVMRGLHTLRMSLGWHNKGWPDLEEIANYSTFYGKVIHDPTKGSLRNLSHAIAKHEFMNAWRKEARRDPLPLDDENTREDDLVPPPADNEFAELVAAALAAGEVTYDELEVFIAHQGEGHKLWVIAARIGKSVSTTSRMGTRALKKLRQFACVHHHQAETPSP